MKQILTILTTIAVLLFSYSNLSAQKPGMDKMWGKQDAIKNSTQDARTAAFADGNYAMFIHWGVYSNIGNKWKDKDYYGISEWIMHPRRAGISPEAYRAEAKNFNPVNFDAKATVQLAKDAGMKTIVITSKHHDGFAMYDSKSNDFNIVDQTPFARDPMKELAAACKEAGLGFGFYYSHNQDWTFPGGNRGPKTTADGKEVGFDYYFKHKCLPQVKEITTQYGDIAIVWFDTPGTREKKYVEVLVNIVKKNQPNALVAGRAGHGLGDYKSFGDMNIPEKNVPGLWESVDVTNDSWGYAWYDNNWKSSKRILTNTISTIARGGTYMLNVGPGPDGSIPTEAQHALRKSGEWIKKYPQIVYKTKSSPWGHVMPWGDATISDDGKINLCVYDWPLDGELSVPGLQNNIKAAHLFVNGKRQQIGTSKKNGWTTFYLPAARPEKLISVIELEVEGDTIVVDETFGIDPTYETTIPVGFATAEGCVVEHKRWMEKFGEWKHISQAQDWTSESTLSWEVEVMNPGFYQVDLNYAGKGRMVWRIENEEGDLVQNQQNSSHIYSFFEMGLLEFKKPGKHKITVKFIEGDHESASLKTIKLTPLESLD
jgi:alpha-L-fucosidase